MYNELLTRPDLNVFLPPIGSISVYIFGKVEDLSNEKVELSLRCEVYLELMMNVMAVMCLVVIFAPADLILLMLSKKGLKQPSEGELGLLFTFEKKVFHYSKLYLWFLIFF